MSHTMGVHAMYHNHRFFSRRSVGALATAALGLLLAAAAPAAAAYPAASSYDQYGDTAGYDGSYSYVRTIEGSATLIQGDNGDRDSLEINQPVLVGDRILVSPRGRVEVVLSDRNLVRIDGGSEVVFESLVASPDREDRDTVLRLSQGNVQLVVVRDYLGEGVPRVDTPNVTVYPRELGSYRITADGSDWTSVVARDGSAEVVTREGSVQVRSGEEAVVEGNERPRQRVRTASRQDSLELWGQRLDQEARYASADSYVGDSLGYEASALDRHGSWVRVDDRYAWRPRVAVEWRPYSAGRWSVSPLGLTWVSYEPWGWVPYHYGSWDYVPSYGWVWFPGYRFAPAWVYWYWTDAYAGWVPVGYYTRHYRPFFGASFGFRFGIYGWAGGDWGYYDRWTFCSTRYLGSRDQQRYARPGDRFGRDNRYAVPKRGILTTDTRGVTRVALRRSQGIEEMLAARRSGDLPDVTDFVARRRDLSETVRKRVLVDVAGVKGAEPGRDRAQVLGVDGIPGSTSARRLRDAVGGASPRTPDRVTIDRGATARDDARSGAALSRKPAVKPESPTKTARPDDGFRTRPEVGNVERAIPRARAPETSRPEVARPETSRPQVDSPRRIETRPAPAPAPAADWRDRAAVTRKPAAKSPKPPERIEPPAQRSIDRPEVRRIEPGDKADWRERGGADRYSVPRRVIEGVRSNSPSSTPFRPERVETRPAPSRIETRPSPSPPPSRIETRPSPSPPPSRSEARPSSSRPSSPARIESRPSPSRSKPPARVESRPSSPPPSARSAPSRSSSRATSSRSSAASSSKGKARRKPPTE